MPYDAGYQKMTLGGWTPEFNPTEATELHPVKKVVDVVTLTKTVSQHWTPADSDQYATLKWAKMSKTDKDALLALYKASYTSYVFVDWLGNSSNVVIEEMPSPERNTTTDKCGYAVSIVLKCVD